jgi:phage shock protein PspC (stress-responsive transcriptional regulator)
MSAPSARTLEARQLRRSRSDRTLAGVCGGLAAYFEIHPAVFRVAFVVLTLPGGAGVLIYLAAAAVMPAEGRVDSFATATLRDVRDRRWPLAGLALVLVGGAMALSRLALWPGGDAWVFLLLVGALILWIARHGLTAEDEAGAPALAPEDSLRVRRRRRRLGLVVASALALVLGLAAVFTAVFDVHLRHGVDERVHVVTSMEELRDEYRLGVGTLSLDLRSLPLPAGATRVEARVDVGSLRIVAPEGVALRVRASARLGEIDLLGDVVDGPRLERSLEQTGDRVLVLEAHVGLGGVRIVRALP